MWNEGCHSLTFMSPWGQSLHWPFSVQLCIIFSTEVVSNDEDNDRKVDNDETNVDIVNKRTKLLLRLSDLKMRSIVLQRDVALHLNIYDSITSDTTIIHEEYSIAILPALPQRPALQEQSPYCLCILLILAKQLASNLLVECCRLSLLKLLWGRSLSWRRKREIVDWRWSLQPWLKRRATLLFSSSLNGHLQISCCIRSSGVLFLEF